MRPARVCATREVGKFDTPVELTGFGDGFARGQRPDSAHVHACDMNTCTGNILYYCDDAHQITHLIVCRVFAAEC